MSRPVYRCTVCGISVKYFFAILIEIGIVIDIVIDIDFAIVIVVVIEFK
jgi:hypothetical protein